MTPQSRRDSEEAMNEREKAWAQGAADEMLRNLVGKVSKTIESCKKAIESADDDSGGLDCESLATALKLAEHRLATILAELGRRGIRADG